MKGTYLGEFEEVVLLTVMVLKNEAYGNAVLKEIEIRTTRKINLSAVHSALHRLEKKGFLKSYKGEATAIRGGKRKKLYDITPFGIKALQDIRQLREGLWASVPAIILDKSDL
ncbi:PadR family transcriptional regulator [Fulvivirga sp. M361]|uniref:PadR family transcriptional regulator n=1 Tax=Fulvivirga sp. M361 TaxID=2594266 RepID=UPI00117B5E26|nr:PadR family transcriptional regulator [Fulvivirga sp. M361]TRX57540.1 PadR family transcriptional regulator [Fulvivirga sp. M361]